jgi:hypothetical protein
MFNHRFAKRVSGRVIAAIPEGKAPKDLKRRPPVENTGDAPNVPKDARKTTEEQRETEELLEHQDDDPDAPGLHQSRHQTADETTR